MGRRILPRLLSSSSITSNPASNHKDQRDSPSDASMRSKTDSASPVREPGNGLALKVVIMKVRVPFPPHLRATSQLPTTRSPTDSYNSRPGTSQPRIEEAHQTP